MALDSIKSGVSEYKDKKTSFNEEKNDLALDVEKADSLVGGSLGVDDSVRNELQNVRNSLGVHEDRLAELEEQLEREKLDLQQQIDSEQQKISAVQKKIDGLVGKKYTGGVDAVSSRCDELMAELEDLLAGLDDSGSAGGGALDTGGKAGDIVKIGGDSYRVDDNGNPHMKRGEDKEYHVLPNTKYTVNGYTYQTDENGRIIHAQGNLMVKDGERASLNAKVSDMGANDQRGHIIADILGGSNQNDNLVAQLQPINQGAYKSLESSFVDLIDSGNQVYGDYTIEYGDNTSRPAAIMVNYSINGGTPVSQTDTFSKLGLADIGGFTEFEDNLMSLSRQGHAVDCNYRVVFSNDYNCCWLFVEHSVDGGIPTITQFL